MSYNFTNNKAIGIDQDYLDVTSSRFAGSTYTNTTGRTITLSVWVVNTGSSGGSGLNVLIDGEIKASQIVSQTVGAGNMAPGIVIPIPSTSEYVVTTSNSNIVKWFELQGDN